MNNSQSLQCFRSMLYIRRVEEAIADKYPEQKMRTPVHLSIGQEAVAVGVSMALKKEDLVMSGHRSHAHYLAKGASLKAMIAEIYGKETGCSQGRGGSMHMIDYDNGFVGAVPIVGSTIPIAVGLSLSSKQKKNNQITVSYFGEGSTEEGVFYESVNYAVIKNLPILFVCENNLYSVYSPLDVRQPKGRSICEVAKALGLESHHADGNKAEQVFTLAKTSVDKIRAGNGPILLEFDTYRFREHCGPNYDDHLPYRNTEEIKYWKSKDPIPYFQNKLVEDGTLNLSDIDFMEKEILHEIQEAFEFAEASIFPDFSSLKESIFA